MSAYFLGDEALGKAIGVDLNVHSKAALDGAHGNLLTIAWDALVGYKTVRREAAIVVECSNTVK